MDQSGRSIYSTSAKPNSYPDIFNSMLSCSIQKPIQTLIISDLHLAETQPEITDLFDQFLTQIATKAEELIILGDFFDYWIGDDAMTPYQAQIAKKLADLTHQKTRIFIMPGNRDFLIGKAFCEQARAFLLPDIAFREHQHQKILLCHGDQLCTEDHAYQRYRYWTHQTWLQKLFLSLPISFRQKIAQKIRQKSQTQQGYHPKFDATESAITQLVSQHSAQILIHGHTHQPIYQTKNNLTRIVNSDWHADQASFIEINTDGIFLREFKFKPQVPH